MNTTTISERDKAYFDIFVTGIEGGINYWAEVTEYHWTTIAPNPRYNTGPGISYDGPTQKVDDVLGFYAVITDGPKTWRVDRKVIARGVRVAYEEQKTLAKDSGSDGDNYVLRALSDLKNGEWELLDFDADVADVVTQCGLFGKTIYG